MRNALASLCLVVILLGAHAQAQPAQVIELAVGEPAPDFFAVDSQGREHRLSQYRNSFVVLEWVNPDCAFVKKHYGAENMQTLQRDARAGGIVWLTVASSAPGHSGYLNTDRAERFLLKTGATPTAVLLDYDGRVGRLYDADVTPEIFIVDPEGILVYMGGMDDMPTSRWTDVDLATDFVGEALDEVLAGRPISRSVTHPYGCPVNY